MRGPDFAGVKIMHHTKGGWRGGGGLKLPWFILEMILSLTYTRDDKLRIQPSVSSPV